MQMEEEEEVNTPVTRSSDRVRPCAENHGEHTFLTPPRAFRREDPEPLLRPLEDCWGGIKVSLPAHSDRELGPPGGVVHAHVRFRQETCPWWWWWGRRVGYRGGRTLVVSSVFWLDVVSWWSSVVVVLSEAKLRLPRITPSRESLSSLARSGARVRLGEYGLRVICMKEKKMSTMGIS